MQNLCKSGSENFTCKRCKRVFNTRNTYDSHIKIAKNCQKSYICKICRTKFENKSNYERHINKKRGCVKMDINENQCHLCLKVFSRKYDVMRHLYVCPVENVNNIVINSYNKLDYVIDGINYTTNDVILDMMQEFGNDMPYQYIRKICVNSRKIENICIYYSVNSPNRIIFAQDGLWRDEAISEIYTELVSHILSPILSLCHEGKFDIKDMRFRDSVVIKTLDLVNNKNSICDKKIMSIFRECSNLFKIEPKKDHVCSIDCLK